MIDCSFVGHRSRMRFNRKPTIWHLYEISFGWQFGESRPRIRVGAGVPCFEKWNLKSGSTWPLSANVLDPGCPSLATCHDACKFHATHFQPGLDQEDDPGFPSSFRTRDPELFPGCSNPPGKAVRHDQISHRVQAVGVSLLKSSGEHREGCCRQAGTHSISPHHRSTGKQGKEYRCKDSAS